MPEQERAWWLEHHRAKDAVHSCGHPRDVCADAEREWFPQLTVCYPTMVQQSVQAKYERRRQMHGEWHDGTFTRWASKPDDDHPFHFQHGTTVWVSEVDHGFGGDFLTSGSQQREGEDAEADNG